MPLRRYRPHLPHLRSGASVVAFLLAATRAVAQSPVSAAADVAPNEAGARAHAFVTLPVLRARGTGDATRVSLGLEEREVRRGPRSGEHDMPSRARAARRGALVGAAIGAGAGAVFVVANRCRAFDDGIDGDCTDAGTAATVGGVLGGGVGALIGAAVGALRPLEVRLGATPWTVRLTTTVGPGLGLAAGASRVRR